MLSYAVLPRGNDWCGPLAGFHVRPARATDMDMDRAFLVSYLLTGDTEAAEASVLLAIESWKPENESGEHFFRNILQTAVANSIERTSFAAAFHLPDQLQNVINLAGPLRRLFVLRILVGLPAEVCAELSNVDSRLIDAHLRCAFVCLGVGASD